MEIDFMIKALNAAGLSDADIAREISTDDDRVAPSIVNRWKNGVHKRTSHQRYFRVHDLVKRKKLAA